MDSHLTQLSERNFCKEMLNALREESLEPNHPYWVQASRSCHNFLSDYAGGLEDLCRLGVSTSEFNSGRSYYCAAQFSALFNKRDDVGDAANREQAALQAFLEAEDRCTLTNKFLWDIRYGARGIVPPVLDRILARARSECRKILGPVPSWDDLPCYLGPGATTQVVRRNANVRLKLSQPFACSEDMLPSLTNILESMPDFTFREVTSGEVASVRVDIHRAKLGFVPKSYKTFRSICVEPWLNSFMQLGLGTVMTRRMRSYGLDLSEQVPNQELARRGSIDGSLATVDLSSASDSVSIQLVRELLPDDWFEKLSHTRSSEIEYNGVVGRLAKFSSMGNGFTFPLQSLIFYTLTRAVCRELKLATGDVRAYGDDIICPTEAYSLLTSTLTLLGFKVNSEKSFHTGPFRESCGKDYWLGIDVRPLFLRNRPTMWDMFTLHNGFVRKHEFRLAEIVARYIPSHLALYGPDGYGDGHLLREEYPRHFKHLNLGWAGYTFDTYTKRGRKTVKVYPGDYLYPSYSIYRMGEGESRGATSSSNSLPGTKGYKRISIYTLG